MATEPGPDKVVLMKQETAATGGDPADDGDFGEATPLDSSEDSFASAGGFVHAPGETSDTVGWYRNAGRFVFFDVDNPTGVTLGA